MLHARSQIEAERLRADLGLGSGYVDVFDVARRLGAEVYFHPFGGDGVEGAYKLVDGLPFILINADRPLVRRRFSMAHEIGHLRLGGADAGVVESNRTMDSPEPDERNANRFGAYLLMDPDGVRDAVSAADDPLAKIVVVANAFVVSPTAAAIHLSELRLIRTNEKEDFVQAANSQRVKTRLAALGYKAPPDSRPLGLAGIDPRHVDDALAGFVAGQYSKTALEADLGITIDEVEALLRRRKIKEPQITTAVDLEGLEGLNGLE